MTDPKIIEEAARVSDEILKDYINKWVLEQESLTAKFIAENKCKASDVCLVERETPTGRIFYPEFKDKILNHSDKAAVEYSPGGLPL